MIPLMQYGMENSISPEISGGLIALWLTFMVFFIILGIIMYVYMGITVMKTANKLNIGPAWLAWIPVANVYLILKMGKQPWWPMLLFLSVLIAWIPVIGAIIYFASIITFMVFFFKAHWKICEARQKPKWLVILGLFVPFVYQIMWGILAWGK